MLYTRCQLFALRATPASGSKLYVGVLGVLGLLHYRGTRSGRLTRQRRRCLSYHSLSFESSQTVELADRLTSTIVSKQQTEILVVVGRR